MLPPESELSSPANMEQRALASSVRRNKGNLIPLIYIKGDILEEHLGAIRFANILYL